MKKKSSSRFFIQFRRRARKKKQATKKKNWFVLFSLLISSFSGSSCVLMYVYSFPMVLVKSCVAVLHYFYIFFSTHTCTHTCTHANMTNLLFSGKEKHKRTHVSSVRIFSGTCLHKKDKKHISWNILSESQAVQILLYFFCFLSKKNLILFFPHFA